MDDRLPIPTVHIGRRRRRHCHDVSTVEGRLQRQPEIVQPTFIHVIEETVRTVSVYHRGSCVHHEPTTLFRKSFASPELLFRTLTVTDVHYRSDKLDARRLIAYGVRHNIDVLDRAIRHHQAILILKIPSILPRSIDGI